MTTPSPSEIKRLKTRVRTLEAIIREALEPGVFGPWRTVHDPRIPPLVRSLCEDLGYGAMMSQISHMWNEKMPGCQHTVAACGSVRERWIKDAQAALKENPNA